MLEAGLPPDKWHRCGTWETWGCLFCQLSGCLLFLRLDVFQSTVLWPSLCIHDVEKENCSCQQNSIASGVYLQDLHCKETRGLKNRALVFRSCSPDAESSGNSSTETGSLLAHPSLKTGMLLWRPGMSLWSPGYPSHPRNRISPTLGMCVH